MRETWRINTKTAGVENTHMYQTRHSFARIIAEETGSITDVQDALDHRNAATTMVYVRRIAIKKDKHSQSVSKRLSRNTSGGNKLSAISLKQFFYVFTF